MGSRRGYPSSEVYQERDRDYYSPRRGNRVAEYDEVDIRERRRTSDRQPDFLRDDYGRSSNAGALVVHDDKRSNVGSTVRNRDEKFVETDEVLITRKGERAPPKVRPVEREEAAYQRKKRPPTEIDYSEREEIIYRDHESHSPPPQQIAREREEFYYRPRERSPPQIAREHEEYVFRQKPREPTYEREEIVIREGERERERERPRERDYRAEEIIIRRDEREKERPRERERDRGYEEEEVIIRRDERERRPRERDYRDEEIIIRERDRERQRPRASSYERESLSVRTDDRRSKSRDYREEDIVIRRGEGKRPRPRSPETSREEDIYIRRSEMNTPRERSRERGYQENELVVRERDRPRERSRSRRRGDEEDIIFRHEENDRRHRDEIIIRRNERSPSPEPEPYVPPAPPPAPEPTKAPPIIQEIITHHRHIDHGFERAPAPTPPPPPPRSPSPKDDFQQIEIRRHGERNGRHYDEDIIIDSGRRDDRAPRRRSPSPAPSRRHPSPAPSRRPPSPAPSRRPPSPAPSRRPPSPSRSRAYTSREERDIAEEAAYYNDRVRERGYIGESYNGATKDWAIVDVPPGTRRVEMEGVGGAKEEVTWQRYNGVRRSKFVAEDDEPRGGGGELIRRERDIDIEIDIHTGNRDRGRRFAKEKSKTEGMWTEITKDLVSEEAIKEAGLEYEETEFFYYVMTYLRYEDVQDLVDLSEAIKKGRKERIREMQFEREERRAPRKQLALPWDEERIVEREVIYDGPPPRRYR